MISTILGSNLGEIQLLLKKHKTITSIPTETLNEKITPHIQRLIFADSRKRASYLETLRESVTSKEDLLDLTEFSEPEILRIARGE